MAEWTGLSQKEIGKRLLITIPLLGVGALLTQLDYNVIWRYFSWSNQTLAMISLWVATSYLVGKGKYRLGSLMTAIPACYMSAVSLTYILMADEGFRLPRLVCYPAGILFAIVLFGIYLYFLIVRSKKKASLEQHSETEVKSERNETKNA
ncbi:MAG: hypothetical protein J5636_01835 [Clostridiales bacterium]|nr:hypothetical protein [Clostridiales bacterium]